MLSWTDERNGVNIGHHADPVGPRRWKGAWMRRLLIAGALGFMVLSLSACDRSNEDAALVEALQLNSDRYEIDQIEKKFHEATTQKDIDLMMSLWAPNATFTVGPGATAAGVEEIRQFWLTKADTFQRRDPLGLGSPRLQGRDHGQRRQGHAALRVPLHRLRDRQGRVHHGRRL